VRSGHTTLTTRGRCLLAGGVATAACAVALDERDLLRVGAFVALLPLLALVLAALGRRTVRVTRTLTATRVPVGATTEVELAVHGRATVGPLELLDTVPDAAGAPGLPRFAVTPRPSGTRVRYSLRPVLRGAHRVGPAVAHGVDPLGLAEFARTVPGTDRLLVLPRTTVLRGLPPALGSADGAHGAGAARTGQGRSDVLVRPYRSGDELRRVHWRSTARHDELMVRLSARTGLDGPALPASADVLAVLGATGPEDVATLLARCRGRGHAVLLDVGTWGAPRVPADRPDTATAPVAATAAALRAGGWAVTVVRRGVPVDQAWYALVDAPVPQAVSS
jgi:hypothetical protein